MLHGRTTEMLFAIARRKHAAKDQVELKLNWWGWSPNKLGCRQIRIMSSMPLSSILMMNYGILGAELEDCDCDNDKILVNNNKKMCGVCYSSWIHINLCGPTELTSSYSEMDYAIARTLSISFQWFRESGEVPVNWKLANVVPVFKKGKKEDPNNYRSVSIISMTGKLWRELLWDF